MGGPVSIDRDEALGRRLRAIFEGGAVAGLGDAALLGRVAAGGDAARAAMAALVERHGAMVLSACRAGTRDPNDADDAFQAVFLVLARRAGSLRAGDGDSIGPWLLGVARRTTAGARVASARRRALDRRHASISNKPDDPVAPDDVTALIHEELTRLPDRYRTPLVLCDLEGLSHEDAARRLGWPVGTVKSRQARGRARLRGRLVRRGVEPAVAAAASVAFGAGSTRAAVPSGLAGTSVEAALSFTTGSGASAGAVPAAPALIARKVLTAMTLSRCYLPALGLALAMAGALALGSARPSPAVPDGPPDQADKPSYTPPPAGSFLQFHFVADARRDAPAIARAMASDLDRPPEGYRWYLLGDGFAGYDRGGMAIRKERGDEWVLLKLDPQEVTERDLARVARDRDDRDQAAISFRFTRSGARRFGELTGSRLPEDGGTVKYRLAVVAERKVVSTPVINSVVRDAAVLSFGTPPDPGMVDRLYGHLAEAAKANADPRALAPAAPTRADATRLARDHDLPALAAADRVTIERTVTGATITSAVPRTVAAYRDALKITDAPPSGGERAATLIFSKGDTPLREVWAYENGEWGFVRQGTSWTVGRSEALRDLVKPHPAK